jgi:hypothetical protein
MEDDTTEPSTDEPTWLRNRRLCEAELDAANARGRELLNRYGDGASSRPRYAELKPTRWRRRS